MAIGISTACFYPEETEKALTRIGETGVRDVEIFFNAQCETREPLISQIREIRRRYDLRVCAIHPYFTFAEKTLLFSRYRRRYDDGADLYAALCETCHALDCNLLVLHGEKEPFELSAEEYIERFGTLAQMVRENGVCLTQENVVRFRSQSPAFLRRMAKELGDLFRMTFDVKQAVRSGVDPLSLCSEFADRIVHVHLSDHGEAGDCLPVGMGTFDFEALFCTLYKAGFHGTPVVELYRRCFVNPQELWFCREKAEKIHKKALQNLARDVTI